MANYTKYSIGEIFLVVIGILIALQVNTWNEGRKNRNKEQILYTNLLNVLDQDLDHVNLKIQTLEKAIEAMEIFIVNDNETILQHFSIEEINVMLDDLGWISSSFMPNKAFYNKLLNNNQIDLVRSNELKVNIIKLYEHYYVRYNDLDLNIEEMKVFHLDLNYYSLIQHTMISNTPVDSALFLEHYEILNKECRNIRALAISTMDAMNNCKNHIELLQEEINKKGIKHKS